MLVVCQELDAIAERLWRAVPFDWVGEAADQFVTEVQAVADLVAEAKADVESAAEMMNQFHSGLSCSHAGLGSSTP